MKDLKNIISMFTSKKGSTKDSSTQDSSSPSNEKGKNTKYIIIGLTILGVIIGAIWGQKVAWINDIFDDVKQVVEGNRELSDVVSENISVIGEKVMGGDSEVPVQDSTTEFMDESPTETSIDTFEDSLPDDSAGNSNSIIPDELLNLIDM